LDDLAGLLQECGLRPVASDFCFHLVMRIFFRVWNWQFRRLGRARRSLMPGRSCWSPPTWTCWRPSQALDLVVLACKDGE